MLPPPAFGSDPDRIRRSRARITSRLLHAYTQRTNIQSDLSHLINTRLGYRWSVRGVNLGANRKGRSNPSSGLLMSNFPLHRGGRRYMTIRKRMVLPMALAVAALVALAVASVANAGHVRPKSASPLKVSLVPGFNACGTPNRQHGPPLAFPSCNPPVASSTAVTVGEPSVNGAAANFEGFVKLVVQAGIPGPPEDSDVLITASLADVRCLPGTVTCGSANAVDGADYTGALQGTAQIRISDHWNAVAAGGGTDPATVVDIPFPVGAACAATASTAIGGLCTANTSANTVVPGAVKDTKRAVIEVGQVVVNDGGPDGDTTTLPNTRFAAQGIFIP
jgi:hypothetical protein